MEVSSTEEETEGASYDMMRSLPLALPPLQIGSTTATLEEQFHQAWAKFWGPITRPRGEEEEERERFTAVLDDFYKVAKGRSKLLEGRSRGEGGRRPAEDLWVEAQTWLVGAIG